MKYILRIACSIAALFFTVPGFSQNRYSSFEQKLIALVDARQEKDALRMIDSAGYDYTTPGKDRLPLFYYFVLGDNYKMVELLVRRQDSIEVGMFNMIACLGNTEMFKTVLDQVNSTNPDDYILPLLFATLTDSSRAEYRKIAQDPNRDLDEWEDLAFTDGDSLAFNLLAGHMSQFAHPDTVADVIGSTALMAELSSGEPGLVSTLLLHKYFYGKKTPAGRWYDAGFLKLAFEQGRWPVVEILLQRGMPFSLKDISIASIQDPDGALGYFVREQLVDFDPSGGALAINRNWRPPAVVMHIPKTTGPRAFTQPFVFDKDLDEDFGHAFFLLGSGVPFTLSVFGGSAQPLSRMQFTMNRAGKEHLGGWQDEYSITVPRSDTAHWAQYHGLTVKNTGDDEYIPGGSKPSIVRVYRGDELLAQLEAGQEETFNRAFGDLVLKSSLTPMKAFGVSAEFSHYQHNTPFIGGLKGRLIYYKIMWMKLQEEETLKKGSAACFDARTYRRLTSEILKQNKVMDVVNAELRIAMKALAEQSSFNAGFSNFVYSFLLNTQVPDALEPFLLSADPVVRQQARALQQAINQHSRALELLDEENIRSYTAKISQVKNLMLELAQYCPEKSLLEYLNTNLNSLSPALRATFRRNVKESGKMIHIDPSQLNGKGGTLLKFLEL